MKITLRNQNITLGLLKLGDAKSAAMDAFNDAYLANDMTGQDELFAESAVANVNGVETTPASNDGRVPSRT